MRELNGRGASTSDEEGRLRGERTPLNGDNPGRGYGMK
jgi:hypothetical protein